MSSELENVEFWLPPEFLTDDDILMDFKPKLLEKETDSVLHFPCDYSSGVNSFNPHSGRSSPVESIVSSESEEEEYLAGLTQKMSNSSILDDLWKTEIQKSWGISVSPQSTLCGCKQGSSWGSPNCPSPPLPLQQEAGRQDTRWELLYQAANDVARMRMTEEATLPYQNSGFNPIETNPNLGFQSNRHLSYRQLQIAKQLKREQLLKQLQAARAMAGDRPLANLSPVAWPTLRQSVKPLPQQQPATAGSGVRRVYLENTVTTRERAGTGVFLPRRPGTNSELPKKAGGSTVILPDRVVKAIMDTNYGRAGNMRNNSQKVYLSAPATVAQTDLQLPQEWTY